VETLPLRFRLAPPRASGPPPPSPGGRPPLHGSSWRSSPETSRGRRAPEDSASIAGASSSFVSARSAATRSRCSRKMRPARRLARH
jgi:hypothetical protein